MTKKKVQFMQEVKDDKGFSHTIIIYGKGDLCWGNRSFKTMKEVKAEINRQMNPKEEEAKMTDTIRVWADYYESTQTVRVFINGYALILEESTMPIARTLAKAAGQSRLPIHTYKISGPPTHIYEEL